MKKFLLIFSGALLLSNLFLTTGCSEDPVDEPKVGPLLVLTNSPATTVSGIDETVSFTVEATKGTDPLSSLVITENGTNVSADRLTITGIGTANNPQLVTGDDKDGFTWSITMNVHDAFDQRTYTVTVRDEGGLTDFVEFSITVEDPGTPIDMSLTGILWNQFGPAGLGAIDLDNGLSTGVTTPNDTLGTVPADAEIRDLGIDPTIDPNQVPENWRRQIAAMNGTIVRFLAPNAIENFDFDQVSLKEEIEGAFQAASSLPNLEDIDNDGEDELVSDVVQVGDIFVVEKPGTTSTYYLVRVDNIYLFNNSNKDNYRISIKY